MLFNDLSTINFILVNLSTYVLYNFFIFSILRKQEDFKIYIKCCIWITIFSVLMFTNQYSIAYTIKNVPLEVFTILVILVISIAVSIHCSSQTIEKDERSKLILSNYESVFVFSVFSLVYVIFNSFMFISIKLYEVIG